MKQSILDLTRRLVATPSVSPSRSENDVIDLLEADLSAAGVEILDSPLREIGDGRRNLYARVRGSGRGCVLLSGHIDTVPIEDFARYAARGATKEIAFDPDALEKILGPQYGAGRYLYGRGALDMKGAVATCATLMKRFAERPETLPGEVLFVAVCDEENASAGILKAGEFLRDYRRREAIEYRGFINTDYTSPAHEADPTRFVYSGTIGKLLPAMLVCGRVSHVGEPFVGFPATLLAAAIQRRIEMCSELCESAHGEVTPPATCLKSEDLKGHYDVQTPRQVHLYYNLFTFERSPQAVLDQMKSLAVEAFEETLTTLAEQEQRHAARIGQVAPKRGWQTRVLSLEELKRSVAAAGHDPEAILQAALEKERAADERVACREAVRALWDHLPNADEPGVVVYLAPPYYPGFATPAESALGRAVKRLVERHRADLPQLVLRHFYPYISDMSYLAFPESLRSGIPVLQANLPGWGQRYRLDLEGIAELDMPVVNLGPVGFDAHKDTERVEIDYSFGVLPGLIEELVRETLEGHGMIAAWALGLLLAVTDEPPADFPHFLVPGQQEVMGSLRHLYAQHYAGAGPKSTLWDAWLPGPALWPDTSRASGFESAWKKALLERDIDEDGYVATHQHPSIAHPRGWPFPFWNQGQGGRGWHFSFEGVPGPPWRQPNLSSSTGFVLEGVEAIGTEAAGWRLRLERERAVIRLPGGPLDTLQSPFFQIRWRGSGLEEAQVRLTWANEAGERHSSPAIAPPSESLGIVVLPLHASEGWLGRVSDLRLELEGAEPPAELVLHSLFTQYDTRHNVNSQAFILGVAKTFAWTGDLDFLRAQMPRLRLAAEHVLTEHGVLEVGVVRTRWVGHDGRVGFTRDPSGRVVVRSGHGIGNNYWDLLPFGHLDTYATSLFIAAARALAELEDACASHPDWKVAAPDRDATFWSELAERMTRRGQELFWSEATGRFVACVDADGQPHDYGFTFVNLEAIHYGLAGAEQARSIASWIGGERIVPGDTSTGADIYAWRFGPRATTRRNVDWYGFFWTAPESIPWGGQVQDGGAVLGFSYFDLMAKLKVGGPDEAWRRLQGIAQWYDEVRQAGGYRQYYDGTRPGTLQGGGTAGGLGLDREFFESVLVPQVLIDGFLGLTATPTALRLEPRLPGAWPSLTLDGIRYRGGRLRIEAKPGAVTVHVERAVRGAALVEVPGGSPGSRALETGFEGALSFEVR